MSGFNKDDYLNDLPDADDLANKAAVAGKADSAAASPAGDAKPEQAAADPAAETKPTAAGSAETQDSTTADAGANAGSQADASAEGQQAPGQQGAADAADGKPADGKADTLTPLGQAKKEAAEYLEALQRERAEFINYRNRAKKEQDRFRQHGIIDVLTALLPALDDIDRIREHSEMDDSFKAVAAKIDKAFEKFGVEKFGEKGEEFDPTKHEAILHKPDDSADKETVDTVVEAGYRIGDRVIRAARVVVASPKA
ncbi:nucleotide exchange factor GrpE [Bifidobacterium leontopitheci]|uniref:Protein GrpE n=1 Tax=Bifidobacterium leontopitheci TaxID=2650774 RepID=A0A6I1GDC5_9BIFI|nr:nucleotide exchange factor GrpE [Bifidobacterium leontopitheci]KAB7789624.1 nucleotide exchange factor GrpE [Bifidobacterium leontopitheci]